MERCWLVLWISVTCLFGGALPQYRDKNISRETDAVQGILARYLQKRLQGVQIFNPPPPSVLFSLNRQSRARKTVDKSDDEVDVDLNRTGSEERREDYDDYEDDLQGFEDSECSRTRINLFDFMELRNDSGFPCPSKTLQPLQQGMIGSKPKLKSYLTLEFSLNPRNTSDVGSRYDVPFSWWDIQTSIMLFLLEIFETR